VVKRYLDVVPLEEALRIVTTAFPNVPSAARVPLMEAPGRITAGPIFAQYSVPMIHIAAMDGIAVRSSDTAGASEQHPVTLPDAARVNTGNIVPDPYDAVIMIEEVWIEGNRFTIRKAASPWQHVRPAGEDIGESEMVLPGGHRIRPHEIGALATYGVTEVAVVAPAVGLLPTGSELVPPGTRPLPGQVVESNTEMAAGILGSLGARCTRYPITRDEPAELREAMRRGVAENDILIVSAGSSAGTRDYTADIIAELGEVLVHGVAIKPGKPAIIGRIGGKPVIGMPGYPLSALTVLREIVTPLLAAYGLVPPQQETVEAAFTATLHKEIGTDEFVLLTAGTVGGRWVAAPQSRGAGVQMSAVRANAYLRIPSRSEGVEAGQTVRITLTVPRADAESALLVTGSHDPALDYLADLLQERGIALHSAHVGSMGGILALKRRECHAAPMHLLAPDGSYNVRYLEKYLPGEEIVLVCVAGREQGIVSKNGIGFDRLPEVRFVNRQKGSGTRMLLDHELAARGMESGSIRGYEREVTTHLAVALAVKSGEADAGMCVYSAAKALGLAFTPVGKERYEMAVRKESMEDDRVRALTGAIGSPQFKDVLRRLGGYDVTETGVRRGLP
jgi:putative molybdopterin biosynthesis protein